MSKAVVITEKPSVAQDIVDVLGGFTEHDGWFEGNDYIVTFAVDHLFELLAPEEVDEKYKAWTLDALTIVPEEFRLKPKKGQSERIRTIKKLLFRDDVTKVVNACDAGREGELIFREIVEYLGCDKPIQRLWLQSMTNRAIAAGFENLRPGEELEGLANAAACADAGRGSTAPRCSATARSWRACSRGAGAACRATSGSAPSQRSGGMVSGATVPRAGAPAPATCQAPDPKGL